MVLRDTLADLRATFLRFLLIRCFLGVVGVLVPRLSTPCYSPQRKLAQTRLIPLSGANTPPICIAVLSVSLSSEEREYFQCSSHLYRSTPPICIAILWGNLGNWGHWHVPHDLPTPRCPTYQLRPLSFAKEIDPKMPIRDPQNEFPGIPWIGLLLGINIFFDEKSLNFLGIIRHLPEEGVWDPRIAWGENVCI